MKHIFFLLIFFCFSCKEKQSVYDIPLQEMTDTQYPDNPSLESRHSQAKQLFFKNMILTHQGQNTFDLDVFSHENGLCKISLKALPLLEMMPTAPDWIKKDDYLTYIGVINQEWNRQQVQFKKGMFTVSGKTKLEITRVDLARNCLNAYLWEVLIYAKDNDGKDKLFWQCWFNFPKELYKDLFEERNNLSYETFRAGLENWIDPETKKIDFDLLRQIKATENAVFETKNEEMYFLKGERERKRKNIVCPKVFKNMNDLLHDSTTFATFSIPGYYNTKDPRKTELSKLGILQKVIKRKIINAFGKESIEFELDFVSNQDNKTATKFILGGLDMTLIPKLATENAHDGWQTSMGVSNHSFYETFDFQQKHPTKENGFYTFLVDKDNRFLDSHKIGIDGPLLHFDDKDPSILHIWILSFERHAFVGHFVVKMS